MTRVLIPCAVCLLLAGCAVGPDHQRPQTREPVPAGWAGEAQPSPVSAPTDERRQPLGPVADNQRWWEAFGDPELNVVIAEALARNNDLEAATARVLEARAQVGGATAALLPSLSLGAAASRSRTATGLTFPGFNPIQNSFTVTGTATWEADLWGKLRRGRESSLAVLLAGEEERRALAQSLIANAVLTWLQIRELEMQVELNERTVASYRENVNTVSDRYRRGIVSSLDLRLARQNLTAAEASGPALKQELAAARRRLEILAGRYPAGLVLKRAGLDENGVILPHTMPRPLDPVPAGLPSGLLDRRPDLLAAEARLHAATANIGQAKAALYPRFSLTADGGSKSRTLSDLFTEPTKAWSLVGNLVMPLINRGATQAQIKAAEARAQAAVAAYRSAVLQAFAEVENALDQDYYFGRQEELLLESTAQARESVTLAEDRYVRGLDNLLITLDAQRRLDTAESRLLSVQRARRAARVNLILALGGPWADAATEASTETNRGVVQ